MNRQQSWRRVSGACIALGLVALAGCAKVQPAPATPAAHEDNENRPFVPPITLTNDPMADAVVRVAGPVGCTGTLIADDLVLTAHHCVSARDGHGKVLEEDVEPNRVHIEIGGGDFPYATASVRAILAPECGYAQGTGDIAILVLSRRLVGMPTWSPRIDRTPKLGDPLDPIGFGRCAMDSTTIHRELRPGGTVLSISPDQIVADASICPGDSGGPVFDSHDSQHEVEGVISASVMDMTEKTVGRSYFTRLDAWKPLFIAAREVANGADENDLPPFRTCGASPGAD